MVDGHQDHNGAAQYVKGLDPYHGGNGLFVFVSIHGLWLTGFKIRNQEQRKDVRYNEDKELPEIGCGFYTVERTALFQRQGSWGHEPWRWDILAELPFTYYGCLPAKLSFFTKLYSI